MEYQSDLGRRLEEASVMLGLSYGMKGQDKGVVAARATGGHGVVVGDEDVRRGDACTQQGEWESEGAHGVESGEEDDRKALEREESERGRQGRGSTLS